MAKKTKRSKKVNKPVSSYNKSRRIKVRGKCASILGTDIRERIIYAVIGDKCTGKTYSVKKQINKYKRRFKTDRVLIVDFNEEYTEYPVLNIKEIQSFKGVARIPILKHSDLSKLDCLPMFRDGLLVLDGMQRFIDMKSNLYHKIVAMCCVPRTKNYDVLITAQSMQSLSVRILHNTDVFAFYRTLNRSYPEHINLFIKAMPYMQVALDAVEMDATIQNNRYACVHYDARRIKVIGATEESLYWACVNHFNPQIAELTQKLTS